MDLGKLILDNSVLIINIVSAELGLLVGMWLRGRFIDKASFKGSDIMDFIFFSIVLLYLTIVATFSNWPIPAWGYAGGGVVLPPFTVPLYNGLVASAPTLLKALLPQGLLKWVLEHTKAPVKAPSNSSEETENA